MLIMLSFFDAMYSQIIMPPEATHNMTICEITLHLLVVHGLLWDGFVIWIVLMCC